MIDPLVSLAFSVYSNKGTFALLLGSGVSRPAGIPTGWEVVLDLVRKLAVVEGENCEPTPEEWFKRKYGADPDYSKLLDSIAKTPAERQQLLRQYFEPSEDERKDGLKVPTAAHKAIAQLVAMGYIRVVITTNFDRLLEKALEDAGVSAAVISNSDGIGGALPLTHSGPTILKIHGDYMDLRIKNTLSELTSYDAPLNRLLDQIFDEYGLIVCGWSADWDIALRNSIERCPSRRFTTFWTTLSDSSVSESTTKLCQHRKATVIEISGADKLFVGLREKVQALEDISSPHPLSAKMAVATLKRYLLEDSAKIKLRDIVCEETERLYSTLNGGAFPLETNQITPEDIFLRLQRYEALSETLLRVTITGCFWGREIDVNIWSESLERIANPAAALSGSTVLIDIRRYPALLLFYGAGMAAISGEKHLTIASILTGPKVRENSGESCFALSLYPLNVIHPEMGKSLPGMQGSRTPGSDLLYRALREPIREYIVQDIRYEATFDRFEYLLGLVHWDLQEHAQCPSKWAPVGRFDWCGTSKEAQIENIIEKEITKQKDKWPLLKAGLFNGSIERLKESKAEFDNWWKRFSARR